jgi:hypothetical protein
MVTLVGYEVVDVLRLRGMVVDEASLFGLSGEPSDRPRAYVAFRSLRRGLNAANPGRRTRAWLSRPPLASREPQRLGSGPVQLKYAGSYTSPKEDRSAAVKGSARIACRRRHWRYAAARRTCTPAFSSSRREICHPRGMRSPRDLYARFPRLAVSGCQPVLLGRHVPLPGCSVQPARQNCPTPRLPRPQERHGMRATHQAEADQSLVSAERHASRSAMVPEVRIEGPLRFRALVLQAQASARLQSCGRSAPSCG